MLFVEFSPRAENGRTAAPLATRRKITQAIRLIAEHPEWGDTASRFLSPGGENTGLIVDTAVRGWVIVYRVKSAENRVWIEDIRQIMIG